MLPTRRALERFIGLFFDCFHPHFPIMHVPTFNPSTVQSKSLSSFVDCSSIATFDLLCWSDVLYGEG